MAPLTAWLPARSGQDFDLIVKIVGPGASALLKEWAPIAQFLVDRGFAVMAEAGQFTEDGGDFVLGIRIAARPFFSMGHGCDILVHLTDAVPDFWRFNLQPGSVLLWEPPTEPRLSPTLPEGVIAYPIPLVELSTQCTEGLLGKGIASLGALLHLLGIPEEAFRRFASLVAAPRSFAAGWDFARRALKKHDVYSLPLPTAEGECGRLLLSPEQAILAGFSASSCECGTQCGTELARFPAQWIARHMRMAGSIVSVLESDRHPGVQAYRGPQGKVMALLRGNDSAIATCLEGFESPRVFVAADIPDALKLVIAGHDLIRSGLSDGVGILIEDTIALRHQSVDLCDLGDMIRRRNVLAPDTAAPDHPDSVAATDPDRDAEADVGFVAWGAAQGVVRDAVALCRSFGLRVAGFYPKLIVPFPFEAMEAFAKTVGRVVLVESGQTQGYWDRLRGGFSFEPTLLTPQPGTSLTLMDIFLREGLGAV